MVATPWGTSELLRERKLRPGPGNRAEEVAHSQRERVFGAMVVSVAERGYIATKISDLAEISGVSSRTIYDLFGDKESCFLQTIQAVLQLGAEGAAAADAEAAKEEQGWEERALSGFRTFAEMIASQPAAARMVLIEAYAAGPEVLKVLDDATAAFEWLAQQTSLDSPERVGMPAEMMTAHVGALQEIARNRLRRDAAGELPELMDEVAEVMLSYRPPPQPLRLTTRPPAPRPEDLDAHNHAERALRAFAMVVAEKGYAQTTMLEVIARASMSPTTFYANFSDKEDALMAAIDSAGAQVVAAVMPAFERSTDWPTAVRAAYGALFGFLVTRPALAHLMAVGVYGAGLPATQRRAKALAPLRPLIEAGPALRMRPLSITLEVIAGAVYGLMYRQVRRSGPESLPALAPICTYLTLAPFIGAEEACTAANGDGQARGSGADLERRILPSRVLETLERRGGATAESISQKIGVSTEEVLEQLANLVRTGLVVFSDEGGEDGASPQRIYRNNHDFITVDEWESMSRSERQRSSRQIVNLVTADMDQAIARGTFDARVDRHLTRVPLYLDEEGWKRLMAIHHQAFSDSLEVQAESEERLKRSEQEGIPGSSVQAMFEVPEAAMVELPDPPAAKKRRDEGKPKPDPSG